MTRNQAGQQRWGTTVEYSCRVLLSAFLCVGGLGCGATPTADVDDYPIYGDFLSEMTWERAALNGIEIGSLVVQATTGTHRMAEESNTPWRLARRLRNGLPSLQSSTIESFQLRNRAPGPLDAARFRHHTVTLISDEEISQIFTLGSGGSGWWPEFYERFPDSQGLLSLSRVGVSSDGTQALLYYQNTWGGLAGIGEFVVLDKARDRWSIGERLPVWRS